MDKYGNKNLCFRHALISSVSFIFRTVVFTHSKLISRLIRHSESMWKYDHSTHVHLLIPCSFTGNTESWTRCTGCAYEWATPSVSWCCRLFCAYVPPALQESAVRWHWPLRLGRCLACRSSEHQYVSLF